MIFYGRKEDPYSDQFETLEQAKSILLEILAKDAVSDMAANGEVFYQKFDMVKYHHESEEIIEEFVLDIEYEHYHGDFNEHAYYGV